MGAVGAVWCGNVRQVRYSCGVNFPRANQKDGPLAGHVRNKRVYKPPLMATGLLNIGNWIKDDFPDLLWPALILADHGEDGIRDMIRWQKAVQDRLSRHGEDEWIAERLDGRLTSLEDLAKRFPDAETVVVQEARRHGLLSESVARALASYQHMPAQWISGGLEVQSPDVEVLELVRDALLGAVGNGHHEALIKCLRIWSTVQAGTFRSDGEAVDLLKDYPGNLGNRAQTDAIVRAMWGAHKGLLEQGDSSRLDAATDWARVFWEANSMTSDCIRQRDLDSLSGTSQDPVEAAAGVTAEEEVEVAPADISEGGEHLRGLVMDLMGSFVEALETARADLYSQERQEVVSGLVSRAGRDLIAVLGAPSLWCLEHSAHIMRMLVETKIYLRWMGLQDPGIYKQFQEYGAGKAKLYAEILDEIPDHVRQAGFDESIEELRRLSRNDNLLDLRTVDTRDTFSGTTSIRGMAEEGGLLDLYRYTYTMSSGIAHSEWWSIEEHAMERCHNVLHGMHLIPNLSINPGGDVELARAWVDQFHALMCDGLQILRTDESAVARAFSWLDADKTPATAEAPNVDSGRT